jgi:uncharacterized protein YjbJ (UPF0337 family)
MRGLERCRRVAFQEDHMDKQHIKGAIDKAKGAIKETIGKAIGDTGMQVDGKVDKLKGEGRQMVGDAKDAMRDADKEASRSMGEVDANTRAADRDLKRH